MSVLPGAWSTASGNTRTGANDGFTKRYKLDRLVLYEAFATPSEAIAREKQIKGWSRKKKVDLINSVNPKWLDLSEGWSAADGAARGQYFGSGS